MTAIVVMTNGWVLVGTWGIDPEGPSLARAKVIERWGTTYGLGQLVLEGPQPETRLRPLGGIARLQPHSIVFRLECSPDKWEAHK